MKIRFVGVVGDGYLLCPDCFDAGQAAETVQVLEAECDHWCGAANCHHGSPSRALAFGRTSSREGGDVVARLRDEFGPLWEWEADEDDYCDQCHTGL
jgi:hypothetical protein